MRSLTAGSVSGCLAWFLLFAILSSCLCSGAAFFGGISSTLGSEPVARFLEPYLCPESSRAEIITFQTTTVDEFGNESPATGYEMQCVDESGTIVREPSPDYAFYWIGTLVAGSLAVAAVLALALALPVAGLIARYTGRRRGAKDQPPSVPPGGSGSPQDPD